MPTSRADALTRDAMFVRMWCVCVRGARSGDWMMGLAWCLCCGGISPLAYFYAAYFLVLLIHRAVLGSVERMFGILTEHFGGKWPFWLSPRQIVVVPVAPAHYEYAHEVRAALHKAGFYADVDDSSKTFTRKLVEGQKAQYNFQLVVGDKDMPDKVSPRRREEEGMDKKDLEMPQMTIADAIAMFQELTDTHK